MCTYTSMRGENRYFTHKCVHKYTWYKADKDINVQSLIIYSQNGKKNVW